MPAKKPVQHHIVPKVAKPEAAAKPTTTQIWPKQVSEFIGEAKKSGIARKVCADGTLMTLWVSKAGTRLLVEENKNPDYPGCPKYDYQDDNFQVIGALETMLSSLLVRCGEELTAN